eukprot:gene2992-9269_t
MESAPAYCQRLANGVVDTFHRLDTNCEGFYDDFLISANMTE